ncbi:MAG: metallophosphoesterase [Bacilli bacterium]|nr:metallophosphoesterase [Bacilli bacterium]
MSKFSFLEHDIFEEIEKIDPWISSDYHLFKELRKDLQDEEQNKLRKLDTNRVIELHNQRVKPNDVFIFLGDITEEEFADEEYSSLRNIIKTKIKLLKGKKYMIRGNNDKFEDRFYKDCGFIRIYSEPYIETENYLFSHYPIKTPKNLGKINIHGHIHGSKSYWGCDFKDKFDVYWRLHDGPIKLSTIIKEIDAYQNGCKSDMTKDDVYKYIR